MVIIIKGLFSRNGDLSTKMTTIQNKKRPVILVILKIES